MGSLSSASTLAQGQAQYRDNASYEVDGSVAKAKLFLEACVFLLDMKVVEVKSGSAGVKEDPNVYQNALDYVRRWLGANDPSNASARAGGAVRHASFADYRS